MLARVYLARWAATGDTRIQLKPLKITPHLEAYPNADILWCQVRSCANVPHPHDLHVGTYGKSLSITAPGVAICWAPHLHSTECHRGIYPHYAGREPASFVATGSRVFSLT